MCKAKCFWFFLFMWSVWFVGCLGAAADAPPSLHDIEMILQGGTNTIPDESTLFYGAAKGLVRSLGDQHTIFLDPQEAKYLDALESNDELANVNVRWQLIDGLPLITGVPPKSTAAAAGLRTGDFIVKADRKSLRYASYIEVSAALWGKEGSLATLEIQREGHQKTLEFTVQRERLHEQKAITVEIKKRIAVITVRRFDSTDADIEDALLKVADASENGLRGIIVDLRGNPGGSVSVCGSFLSLWIGIDEPFMRFIETGRGERQLTPKIAGGLVIWEIDKEESKPLISGIPTAVIIDEESSSSAEIFAAVMQEKGLAKIIGRPSFGKGAVQGREKFPDGSMLVFTKGQWRTPKGCSIDHSGVVPDIIVTKRPIGTATQGEDRELRRAIRFITRGK